MLSMCFLPGGNIPSGMPDYKYLNNRDQVSMLTVAASSPGYEASL